MEIQGTWCCGLYSGYCERTLVLRIVDYLGVLAFQTTLMTLLVWFEVEQGFGWLDFAFAMSGAAVFTSMPLVLRYAAPKAGWTVTLRLPSGFWPRLLIFLPLLLVISAVPLAAIYVLHHGEFRSRTVIEFLILSVGMAVSLSVFSFRPADSRKPPLDPSESSKSKF